MAVGLRCGALVVDLVPGDEGLGYRGVGPVAVGVVVVELIESVAQAVATDLRPQVLGHGVGGQEGAQGLVLCP